MKSNLRQPGNTTNISDDYQTHLYRGSLGGDDLTDPYGTPVHAQLNDAVVTIVDNSPDGSGGRYSRVTGPDGDSVESLHQASVIAGRGQRVDEHDQIGVSGASAFGSNYGTGGPHIHNHGVHAAGARFSLEPYYWWLNGGSSSPASGGNAVPIGNTTTETDDTEMLSAEAQTWLTATVHDQVDALLRDKVLTAIEKSRSDAVGRQDRQIIPFLQEILRQLGNDDAQIQVILDRIGLAESRDRRESRPRIYRLSQKGDTREGLIGAFDRDQGYMKLYTSLADLQNDQRLGYVANETAVDLTRAEWDDLVTETRQRLANLVSDPTVAQVTGQPA
jgi:hypothetical protein